MGFSVTPTHPKQSFNSEAIITLRICGCKCCPHAHPPEHSMVPQISSSIGDFLRSLKQKIALLQHYLGLWQYCWWQVLSLAYNMHHCHHRQLLSYREHGGMDCDSHNPLCQPVRRCLPPLLLSSGPLGFKHGYAEHSPFPACLALNLRNTYWQWGAYFKNIWRWAIKNVSLSDALWQ